MDKFKKLEYSRIFVFITYVIGAIGLPFYGFLFLMNWLFANYQGVGGNPFATGFIFVFTITGWILAFLVWALIALAIFGYATQDV
jgi:hypothetical protein